MVGTSSKVRYGRWVLVEANLQFSLKIESKELDKREKNYQRNQTTEAIEPDSSNGGWRCVCADHRWWSQALVTKVKMVVEVKNERTADL